VIRAIVLPIAAFAIAAATLHLMLRSRSLALPLDQPNERSLHAVPVPRVGGMAIMVALALAWAFAPWQPIGFACALGLALVSWFDDRGGLPAGVRFGAHLLAAIAFVAACVDVGGMAVAVVATLGIVWMTNLYNFMDGSDGLAGGMAVAGFSAYACIAWMQGDATLASAALAIAGAAAGFLAFNLHPARVFMGDAGSIPLGFLAATMGLDGWARGLWPFWVPLAAFGPFVVDASVTLVRRIARRERVWQAHRTHYYQRLVQIGWGHRRTAHAAFALMAASSLVAVVGSSQPAAIQAVLVAALALVYVVAGGAIDRAWARRITADGKA